MSQSPDVSCVGEVLVDFVSSAKGASLSAATSFLKCAGGACANVAVGLAKLGVRSAFVGKTGNDAFGRFLQRELRAHDVDVRGVRFDGTHKTRLAFVSVDRNADRDFEFWENVPADTQLRLTDISMNTLMRSKIVHMSSFLLLREPSRSTAFAIARQLRNAGVHVSFDPNIRPSLYESPNTMKAYLLKMVRYTTMLRLNDGEARLLTGKTHPADAADKLLSMGPKLVAITLGSRGCLLQTRSHSCTVRGYSVPAVDTTGCGDGFLAGLLRRIVSEETLPATLSYAQLCSIGRFANAAGALTATKKGAFSALPTVRAIHHLLKRR
ncbi:MAG TPA: carbohydrate kinase [Bacteroidota bacterium]|jgi:sugar/nucleoside kinase (ribokinase family)|nr:carbohydrate kinase [Bacteroidota bacterium]